KTSEANAKRAALARGGHDVLQSNPVWQTLALGPLGVQTKLTVSQPDDPYEREADQIADRVIRMTAPPADNFSNQIASIRPLEIQRRCVSCEQEQEELTVQRKCASCADEEKLQRKELCTSQASEASVPALVHEELLTRGKPLDPSTRESMEGCFDRDFG